MWPLGSRPFSLMDSPSGSGTELCELLKELAHLQSLAKERYTHRTKCFHKKSIVLYLSQVMNKRTIKFYATQRCFMESLGWCGQGGWIPTWAPDVTRTSAALFHLSQVHSVLLECFFLKCKFVQMRLLR